MITFDEFYKALECFFPSKQYELAQTQLARSPRIQERLGSGSHDDYDVADVIMETVVEFTHQQLPPDRMGGPYLTKKRWCYLLALEAAYLQYLVPDEPTNVRVDDSEVQKALAKREVVRELLITVVGEERMQREREGNIEALVDTIATWAEKSSLRTMENWRKEGIKLLVDAWNEEEGKRAGAQPGDMGMSWEDHLPLPSLGSQPDPHQPPSLPLSYVTRGQYAESKRVLLEEMDGTAMLVLVGKSGVGKSVLAAALAVDPEVRALLPKKALWTRASLTSSERAQRMRVRDTLCAWIRLSRAGVKVRARDTEKGLARRVALALERSRVLLVLDDVQEVEQIELLLVGGKDSRTVITTRNADLILRLPPGSQMVEVEEWSEEEGVQLLKAVMGQVAADAEPAHLQELVRGARGNARSLVQIGTYAKRYGSAERAAADLRAQTVRKGLAQEHLSSWLNYNGWEPEWRRCYRALGQLDELDWFTVEMFQAAAKVPNAEQALEMLRSFVAFNMLEAQGDDFRLHESDAEFAKKLLTDAGEWDPEHGWLDRYEGKWVRQWRDLLPSIPRAPRAVKRGVGGWRRRIELEIREMMASLQRTYGDGIREVWKLQGDIWDSQDVPSLPERQIVLMKLERRWRMRMRKVPLWIVATVIPAVLWGAIASNVLPMPPLIPLQVPWLRAILRDVLLCTTIGSALLGVWPFATLVMDFRRLRNWG